METLLKQISQNLMTLNTIMREIKDELRSIKVNLPS